MKALVPILALILAACTPSSRHGAVVVYDDATLETEAVFRASCTDPATDSTVLVNETIYRVTTSSTAAATRTDFERIIRAWLAAYPMDVEVHIRRYRGSPLSGRYPGIVWLGWFVRNGIPVVESVSWELERLYYWNQGGADDTSPLPPENATKHAAVIRSLGGIP